MNKGLTSALGGVLLGEALGVQTGSDVPVQILPTVLEDPLHGVVETAQVVEDLERGCHLCRVLYERNRNHYNTSN